MCRRAAPLARRGDQAVMPVVAVIQHAGAALGGVDKEQDGRPSRPGPLAASSSVRRGTGCRLMVTGTSSAHCRL